jgi:hypothetical protein
MQIMDYKFPVLTVPNSNSSLKLEPSRQVLTAQDEKFFSQAKTIAFSFAWQ